MAVSKEAVEGKKRSHQLPRIMIVDDEEQVGELFLRHLAPLGYVVEAFTDPLEAVSQLKRETYDLVITDINMPEMNGLELLQKVKKEIDSSIEVIVVSARGTMEELTQAFRLGASDYIKKPFSLNQMDVSVQRALATRWLKLQNEEYRIQLEKRLKTLEEANRKERAARKALEYLTNTMIAMNEELVISNLRLEKANRIILEANRHKSEFLARMSHELRTPLNSIIGFSEMLEDGVAGNLNGKQLKYVQNILESSHHLLALINDLLDLSKIESGEMELVCRPVLISKLLDECSTLLSGMAKKKEIEIIIQESPQIEIQADPQRLMQIFFNLISNAIKFSPEKSRVEIGAEEKEETILFWVKDYGMGIPKDFQSRVFKKFQQLDTTLARQFEGTGLGLALTKSLVNMHGGEIWFESEEGKGTTFYFTLPKV
ncbi:MAG: hybrid sensor histidine kinase/response regulator, partial [Planctomycetota bacterium]